jgi:hypothetical protein
MAEQPKPQTETENEVTARHLATRLEAGRQIREAREAEEARLGKQQSRAAGLKP